MDFKGPIAAGSEEHKRLFCRAFLETHDPYKPEELPWPSLEGAALERLRALPVWNEAVNTEFETGFKIDKFAEIETDPMLRDAIALQGYEEARHFRILELLTERYGIPVVRRAAPKAAPDREWEFLRVGYGECFDSFFAFGLFSLADRSGFFAPELVRLFEPVMQEEARHIQFFANWVAYRSFRTPVWARPAHKFQRGLAVSLQLIGRVRMALELGGADDANFVADTASSLGDLNPRAFVELCLSESDRRLSRYDSRLLRPRFAPAAARLFLKLAPKAEPAAA
ncbi:MAG TPA: ferritin-like domain-containing protein [Elusimicrobiota bacterium]|nr:ferritin-like domain-containing protein [Elusimicrobiota bacterium]